MAPYIIKTPAWLKKISPKEMVWDMPQNGEPSVYLTFDDGPTPLVTPFVLEQLEKYDADATFFCVGNNVARHPGIYEYILQQGHATANHTYDHVSGWRTPDDLYL